MASAIRFIHAADLHLDAPFKGVDATDERVGRALVESTYRALEKLVDVCIEREADFLIIAGDAYNSRDKSVRAQFAFQRAMQRLAEAGIPVYLVWGNHDPADGWSAGIALPDNVHVFSSREVERVALDRDDVRCALYGRSFRKAAETANLARDFSRDAADEMAIGVLHANVGGRPGHDDYAPCTADDLRAARMDYWALGHIHKPEVLFEGSVTAAYAGCAQGLDPTQTGVRGCWEVSLGQAGAHMTFVPTATIVWEGRSIDVSEASTVEDVHAMLAESCDAVAREGADRPAIVRFELTGRSEVHVELGRAGVMNDLLAEVRAAGMAADPWVWVDRVRDRTRPALDLDVLRTSEEFAGDLVRTADELIADPDAASGLVAELVGPLSERAGIELGPEDAREIVVAARDLALDQLLAGDDR